eukprot:TRINITY_DN78400_c0_g1_i1.p1 TRINITY_DN78400_c0_g1~~TRINITY_DN78400_c0_g1_i1.p1  ORF type:complete len:111 (-),score=12.36 TRINITY_DN78400_c0_g1_i1:252-584(-)
MWNHCDLKTIAATSDTSAHRSFDSASGSTSSFGFSSIFRRRFSKDTMECNKHELADRVTDAQSASSSCHQPPSVFKLGRSAWRCVQKPFKRNTTKVQSVANDFCSIMSTD